MFEIRFEIENFCLMNVSFKTETLISNFEKTTRMLTGIYRLVSHVNYYFCVCLHAQLQYKVTGGDGHHGVIATCHAERVAIQEHDYATIHLQRMAAKHV